VFENTIDDAQPKSEENNISHESLEAIAGTIERLNHLGIAIRKSSVTDQITKARRRTKDFDYSPFERLLRQALKSHYPEASLLLLEHLVQAMRETFVLFHYRQSRRAKLQPDQLQAKRLHSLSVVPEEHFTELQLQPKSPPKELVALKEKHAVHNQPAAPSTMPRSGPTSMNSKEVRKRFGRTNPGSRLTKSILVGQMDYPRPSRGGSICEWCFSPLPENAFKGNNWNQHMNEDHTPYVCLSDHCSRPPVRFAGSAKWHEHMFLEHGADWHQQVYLPLSWACPLCTEDEVDAFSESHVLAEHMYDHHTDVLTQSQIKAIVQQSSLQIDRDADVCLLCCFPVLQNKHDHGTLQNTSQPSKNSMDSSHFMSSHIATHLRTIATLTLRLILICSMDHAEDSTNTDSLGSRATSDRVSVEQQSEDAEDFVTEDIEDFGPDGSDAGASVIGSEVDWDEIPRGEEVSAQQNELLARFSRPFIFHSIPYARNPQFINRPGIMHTLESLMTQSPFKAVLSGPAGIGKSQIALEYAYKRLQDCNCSVFWVQAKSEATFFADYYMIATAFGLDMKLSREALLGEVRQRIEDQGNWLMILDDADDLDLHIGSSKKYMGRENNRLSLLPYLPEGLTGATIYTTRHLREDKESTDISVTPAKPDEAVEFLAVEWDSDSRENSAISAVAERLQWIPLALSQAAAFMQKTSTTPKEYLGLLDQYELESSHEVQQSEHTALDSITMATSISCDWMARRNDVYRSFMGVSTFIRNQTIPDEVFEHVLANTTTSRNVKSPDGVERYQHTFRDWNMIQRRSFPGPGKSTHEMYKGVQQAMRSYFGTYKHQLTGPMANYIEMALQIVKELLQKHSVAAWWSYSSYIEHFETVTRWAAAFFVEIQHVEIFVSSSHFYRRRKKWPLMATAARQVLQLRRKQLGETHRETLISMVHLAIAYHGERDYSAAEELQVKALNLATEEFGEEDLETCRIMMALAETLCAQGRHEEAKASAEKALKHHTAILGESHPETIFGMELVASIHYREGSILQGKYICEKALEIRKNVAGNDDPGTLQAMFNLASFEMQLGYDPAIKLLAKCKKQCNTALGRWHPQTQACTSRFQKLLQSQKSSKEFRQNMRDDATSEAEERAAEEFLDDPEVSVEEYYKGFW
jgi:tetratricopeptide (TPR) repeat protein